MLAPPYVKPKISISPSTRKLYGQAFGHKAYLLLNSSSIHVEQADIGFADDPDLDMDAAAAGTDSTLADRTTGESLPTPSFLTPNQDSSTPHRLASTPQPQLQPQPQKRKTRITHDKHTTMQELIAFHVALVERLRAQGSKETI
ncbi:hypothetical protein FRC10_007941 [Ceratobasidium sp. 414]|nr:hypothetical protein FRC10_007941 [Ceratobasidium sp. 414]